MISILSGKVIEKNNNSIIVDVNGVGYGVYVVYEDYDSTVIKEDIKLYIYEHIRENSHDLFGFKNQETKKLFEQLINVNGIGPKMAVSVLSLGSSEEIKDAIVSGNTRLLQSASGVGKRVAERIVVDLKDKIDELSSVSIDTLMSKNASEKDEALQALVALGYNIKDASNALSDVDNKLSSNERVKEALKRI